MDMHLPRVLDEIHLDTVTSLARNGRFDLVRSVGEECVTDSELRNLVAKKPGFILYDGFEPSGRMHIAQVRVVPATQRPGAEPRRAQEIFRIGKRRASQHEAVAKRDSLRVQLIIDATIIS